MPKFRVLQLHREGDDFLVVGGVGRIIEADSERGAVREVAHRIGVAPHWLKAERLILSQADRHWYLSSIPSKTAPVRRI